MIYVLKTLFCYENLKFKIIRLIQIYIPVPTSFCYIALKLMFYENYFDPRQPWNTKI
jgi:hypothetical protein